MSVRSAVRGAVIPAVSAAIVLTLAFAAVGCGTPSPDLFVVNREGTVPGAKLRLLVSDTTARCNDGPERQLTSAQTIEARVLKDDVLEVQSKPGSVPKAPAAQIFSFSVRTEEGTLRYPDTAQRPDVLPRLTRFTRRVAIDLCGLER